MNAWKCEVCGYVHSAESPPEFCPVCGAGQEHFSRMTAVAAKKAPALSAAWRCTICDHLHEGDAPPENCPVCGAPANLFEPESAPASAADGCDVQRILIVGGGIAGLTAAEEARKAASEVEISLISKEPGLPYYRLNLTRFLAGEVTEDELLMQQRSWYETKKIDLVEGEVGNIAAERREVLLGDGRVLPYDRLVLANGSHPFVPPVAGVTREGVHVLRTLSDARAISGRLSPGMRCVCIGGGLLGLETAGALCRRGIEVTIVEGQPWLLPRQLSQAGGQMLQRHVEAGGMRVRCGTQVQELIGDEHVRGVRLADGSELAAELVILSAGVRPNSYLARQTKLKVKAGVIVNDRMLTSDPAILAAGDVAEHRGQLYGIWPASYAQGVVAGINAVGGHAEFVGLPPHTRLKVLDIELFSIGLLSLPDASYQLIEEQGDASYRCLVCRDNHLVGAAFLGEAPPAGVISDAIEEETPLAELPEILALFPQLAQRFGGI